MSSTKFTNLVLITSVIHTPNLPLSYCNKRSVFNNSQRFEHTKKTFETIKQNIPDCKIIIVECSPLTEEENKYIENNSDWFLNLYENADLRQKMYGISKALAEGTMTIEVLDFIMKNIDVNSYKSLIKISGRYWLSEKFDYNYFDSDNVVVKKIDGNQNNIFTALYKIPSRKIKELHKFFLSKTNEMEECIGFEVLFATFINSIKDEIILYRNTIGLSGYVSVCGSFYNG